MSLTTSVWDILVGPVSLGVGVILGYFLRDVVVEDVVTRKHRVRINWTFLGGISVTILAMVAMVSVVVLYNQDLARGRCQSEYNQQVSSALRERQDAANTDRQAQKDLTEATLAMLRSLLAPDATVDSRRKAVQDWQGAQTKYQDDLNKAETQRNQNPLPNRPDCTRGP